MTDAAWTCSRCLRTQQRLVARATRSSGPQRAFTSTLPRNENRAQSKQDAQAKEEKEEGALSRRLAEMAEETMDTGSKSDRKLMQDMAFSDDLRKQLEDRIAQTAFKGDNQQALSQANIPVSIR